MPGRGGGWCSAGAAVLHLGVEDPFTPARKAHPAFLVEDLDALAGLDEQRGGQADTAAAAADGLGEGLGLDVAPVDDA